MKEFSRKLPLKPYMDEIEAMCRESTHDVLIHAIIDLAAEKKINERFDFLVKIRSLLGKKKSCEPLGVDTVLKMEQNIAALDEDMNERIEFIESGEYWDHDRVDCYDDDPNEFSDEQIEECESYFQEADRFFMSGRNAEARRIYEALFTLIDKYAGLDRYVGDADSDIDILEEYARFCRCVYETASPESRVQEMIDVMKIHEPMGDHEFTSAAIRLPMLQDVKEAKHEEIPHWKAFLLDWQKELWEVNSSRAQLLLLEATHWLDGIAGVGCLAEKWGAAQPRAYLFWLRLLMNSQQWQDVQNVAGNGLKILPASKIRAEIASCLHRASVSLNDPDAQITGLRERFYSVQSTENLLDLIDAAEKFDRRALELTKVTQWIKAEMTCRQNNESFYKKYYVYGLLMAGDLSVALTCVRENTCIGWSTNNTGLVFASIVAYLSGLPENAKSIDICLHRYTDENAWDYSLPGKYSQAKRLYRQIHSGIKRCDSTGEKSEMATWIVKIGRERAHHIVSNTHRKAYDRAAEVLGALAEYYASMNRMETGANLLREFYFRYSRHSAFRTALRSVVKQSPLLGAPFDKI